jgi:hypothetical protein
VGIATVRRPLAEHGFACRPASISGRAGSEAPLTIDQLIAEGWEIAGYDNRTSRILFRHKDTNTLVQCGVLYDVTGNPRTIVNCYELR